MRSGSSGYRSGGGALVDGAASVHHRAADFERTGGTGDSARGSYVSLLCERERGASRIRGRRTSGVKAGPRSPIRVSTKRSGGWRGPRGAFTPTENIRTTEAAKWTARSNQPSRIATSSRTTFRAGFNNGRLESLSRRTTMPMLRFMSWRERDWPSEWS